MNDKPEVKPTEALPVKSPVMTGDKAMALIPHDLDTAYRMASAFARSGFLPKSYTGTHEEQTAKAFAAMQLGAEVGLMPMQAIQGIAVINGMPSIWGDAQKALVLAHPDCEDIIESYEGEWKGRGETLPEFKAVCTVKRKGRTATTREFSVQDAIDAGLWQTTDKVTKKDYKTGNTYEKANDSTWFKYPKRMLGNRARSFALRDSFADALKGLYRTVEEVMDYGETAKDVTPQEEFLDKFEKENTDVI